MTAQPSRVLVSNTDPLLLMLTSVQPNSTWPSSGDSSLILQITALSRSNTSPSAPCGASMSTVATGSGSGPTNAAATPLASLPTQVPSQLGGKMSSATASMYSCWLIVPLWSLSAFSMISWMRSRLAAFASVLASAW